MAFIDPVPTDPGDLVTASTCLDCIPKGRENSVIIYLLQAIAENTMTPNQLLDAARCNTCIPKGMENAVIIYLLDAILAAQ